MSKDNVVLELLAGGTANAIASFLLNPCDVVKLRVQSQPHPPSHPDAMYKSTFSAAKKILNEEGLFILRANQGLWTPGIVPSMLREFSYSSFRFGLYAPVKALLKVDERR